MFDDFQTAPYPVGVAPPLESPPLPPEPSSLKKEVLQKAVTILRQITDETDGWVSITENGWHISTSIPGVVAASIWLMEDKWESYSYVPLGFPIRLKDVADFLRMTIKKGETISLRVDADKREFLITHALDRQFTRGFRWSEDDATYMKQTHGMETIQEARTYEAKFAVNTRELKKSLKLKDIDRVVLAVRGDVCFFLLLSGTELVVKVDAEIDTVRAPTELRHSSYSFIRAFKYLPDTVTMKFNHLGNVVIDSLVDGFLSVVVVADKLDPETSAEIENLLRKEIAPEVKVPEVIKVKVEKIPERVPEKPVKIPEIAAEQLEMRRLRILQEEVCGDLPTHEKDRCKGAMVLYAKDLISKEEFERTLDELSAKSKFMEAIERLGSVSGMGIVGKGVVETAFNKLQTATRECDELIKAISDADEQVSYLAPRISQKMREGMKNAKSHAGFAHDGLEEAYNVLMKWTGANEILGKTIPRGSLREFRSPETMRLWVTIVDEISKKHDERIYDIKVEASGWEIIQKMLNNIEGFVEKNYEVVHPVGEFFKSPLEFDGRMMETLTAYRMADGNPIDTGNEKIPAVLRWCPDPNFLSMVKDWIRQKGRGEADLEKRIIARAQKYNIDLDMLFHQMHMIVAGTEAPGDYVY